MLIDFSPLGIEARGMIAVALDALNALPALSAALIDAEVDAIDIDLGGAPATDLRAAAWVVGGVLATVEIDEQPALATWCAGAFLEIVDELQRRRVVAAISN